jgi:hypothetical protein
MGANAKRCFEERFTVEAMAKSIATATLKWLKYKDGDGSKSHR